ncbi:MAG: HAD hydrolase family protein [Candidatus Gastranaerophilales bacterium]|nr:HAD hydrolase family protein [Candidatus Gastranaerophilales bacterium]
MNKILQNIKLLALDVDGVMTDGSITYTDLGQELKTFNAKDGQGIAMLTKLGFHVAIITARNSQIVDTRARDLGVKYVYQGCKNKLLQLEELKTTLGINYDEIAYMGDDLPDICILEKVAVKACPNDAVAEVKQICNFIAKKNGGRGAIRELTDILYTAVKFKSDKKEHKVDLPPVNR